MLAQVSPQRMVRPCYTATFSAKPCTANQSQATQGVSPLRDLGGDGIMQFCAVQRPWWRSKCGPQSGPWGGGCACSKAAC